MICSISSFSCSCLVAECGKPNLKFVHTAHYPAPPEPTSPFDNAFETDRMLSICMVQHWIAAKPTAESERKSVMPGLLSALEGFCVIGIVIGTGYVAARMRIGGPTAQMVLNRFSFFVSSPCLMFAILSKERIFEIFHSSIVVAFFSAVLVGLVFLILNRLFFHLKAADATIGALNSLYLNSNNIGLPIATYILGNPALVAPILVMQQAVFTPIGLTVLDVTTKGKVSTREILKQPLHQPLLIGSLLGIAVSAISAKTGHFVVPDCIYDPIDMIGDSAVPMILMAFGMSLHGTKPLQDKSNIPAVFTVAVLKNIVMPIIAFLLSYFVMGFRGATLYACVVLAALPTRGRTSTTTRRGTTWVSRSHADGILFSTLTSPIFIAIIAVLARLTSPVLAAVSTTAAARPSIVRTVAGMTEPVRRMIRGTPSEHHQRITQADSRGQRKQRSRIEQRRCPESETATTPSTLMKRPSPC